MSESVKPLELLTQPRDEWDVFVNICFEANGIINQHRDAYGQLPPRLTSVLHDLMNP